MDISPATELSEDINVAVLEISLISIDKESYLTLLKAVVEDINQLDWFVENEYVIRNEKAPIPVEKNVTLAEAIDRFYERYDPDSDEIIELDRLYQFRQQHGIRFAFRGQNIPDVYIGLINGKHEISSSEKGSSFNHNIDINTLFSEIKEARKKYLILISG
jgi:hypothetical protein